jgi:DNA-binding NarL/FixJ family response regulator
MAVDAACSLTEAIELISARGRYTLVLVDAGLPGMDGLEGLERLLQANGRHVALLAPRGIFRPLVERAIDAGACGVVPKTLNVRSFVNAVRFLCSGEVYVPPDIVRVARGGSATAGRLKPVEQNVLTFVCAGMQNKEIGRELNLNEATVKMHVKSVCAKLGAKNRTHAAMIARRDGLA